MGCSGSLLLPDLVACDPLQALCTCYKQCLYLVLVCCSSLVSLLSLSLLLFVGFSVLSDLSKLFKPYMIRSFRYNLVTFSIALFSVILWPVFFMLCLCFLWLLWFVVNFANFVIFLTVYRNILQYLSFSQSGSVTCCRSETKPEHKPHQRSGMQPDTAKRNTMN